MIISDVHRAAIAILDVVAKYNGPKVKKNERAVDPIFMAYLKGEGFRVSRQYPMHIYGARKPHRIDYRILGNRRSVLELAVRPPSGRKELSAASNHSELKKLARIVQNEAHMRYLLLLDFSSHRGPIPPEDMRRDYAVLNAGRGNFPRRSVRVVYAHSALQYDFSWKPWSQWIVP